jgi:hypothetical protein
MLCPYDGHRISAPEPESDKNPERRVPENVQQNKPVNIPGPSVNEAGRTAPDQENTYQVRRQTHGGQSSPHQWNLKNRVRRGGYQKPAGISEQRVEPGLKEASEE